VKNAWLESIRARRRLKEEKRRELELWAQNRKKIATKTYAANRYGKSCLALTLAMAETRPGMLSGKVYKLNP